jgi:hypothetical protein
MEVWFMGPANGLNRQLVATAVLAAMTISMAAHAQTNSTFLLTSTNTVSPSSPTTMVSIWATWVDPGNRFYFRGGNYDLTAGDGQFSNPANVLQGPGSSTGAISGSGVFGGANGQLNFGPLMASRDNPILLATYDWTAGNFTPRTVSLETSGTTDFVVAWLEAGPGGVPPINTSVQMLGGAFTPGSGVITVVPAPAGWLVVALPLVGMRPRR